MEGELEGAGVDPQSPPYFTPENRVTNLLDVTNSNMRYTFISCNVLYIPIGVMKVRAAKNIPHIILFDCRLPYFEFKIFNFFKWSFL